MGFTLKIEGAENIELLQKNIIACEFKSDTPDEARARASDMGVTVRVIGNILAPVNGAAADDTMKLATWSLVPAEVDDSYRKLTIDVISASQVVRQIHLPNAFVIDYKEEFADGSGVGTFEVLLRQKKDKLAALTFNGGFGAE